ncbi:MAG: glycoside hydrolase family 55 protein, partial [Coleofasciculus sp. S288]|nr:glycoside hydrolase family 55 protein [Coleofasciculus sp. S288]
METAYRISTDYPSIQTAIDAGPGTVYIPEGNHPISEPLILPRTDLNGNGGVKLIGAGMYKTFINPSSTSYAYNTMITWQDANYSTNIRRAWFQHLEGFTIRMPRTNANGIWYKRTDLTQKPVFEKLMITIRDVGFTTYNNWEQIAIKLEGNVHDAVIENIVNNIGAIDGEANFDLTTIVSDTNPEGDNGIDSYGIYSSVLRGITVTPISGGFGGVFRGRAQFCKFEDILVGKGSNGTPLIDLIGSCGVKISGMVAEGRAENPQIRLTDCRGCIIEDLILGTPDKGFHDEPYGEGIFLIDCTFCRVQNWFTYPDKALWDIDRDNARRVWLSPNTRNCTVDVMIGGSTSRADRQENPFVVID